MLNCWRVNESCTVDITELLIQKLSAVFATKNLLELGDECDNLNFMTFKTDSFKIRKNSWILGTFKIHKIRILNLLGACNYTVTLKPGLRDTQGHWNRHVSDTYDFLLDDFGVNVNKKSKLFLKNWFKSKS